MVKKKLKEIEEYNVNKDIRKFYKEMGKFNRVYTNQVYNCISKDGKILTGKDEILKRWKEHFQQVFELIQMPDEISTNVNQEISLEGNNEIIEEPTYEEVTEIISSLKNDRSPGSDNIVN